ncbi:hypothetical protein JCM11641_001587 [Rhodosporidiobolus odoratus]
MSSNSPPATKDAVVTLVTSDNYLAGALTSLNSLLDVDDRTRFASVCLVTPATVGHNSIQALQKVFDEVVGVEPLVTESWEELKLLGRRDLALTLTKLHLFRLTHYRKVLFLDADTLVLRPLSHLFDLPYPFAAAPDQGWPDAFNSGVMLAEPSLETFEGLMGMMRARGTWDGGDQGILNDYFPNWHRLSFTYNVTPSAYYTYAPAYQRHGQDVNVLHFIGAEKPWQRGSRSTYDPDAASKDYYGLVNQWFDVYERHFGNVSTWDVAGRVRPPPAFFRSTFTSLPSLSYKDKPSAQDSASPIPTIAIAAPPSDLPPAIPIVASPSAGRAPSPPQLVWDPSRSSPPRNGPFQMREPIPTDYTNAWDDPSRSTRFEPPARYPSPPRGTHDWYKEVMRSKPDPSAVKPVFPWEEPAPAPPTPGGTVPSRPEAPPPPIRTFSEETIRASPASTFGGSANFSNAWDSVPGITRYADQLSKRTTGNGKKGQPVTPVGEESAKASRSSSQGRQGRQRSDSSASAKGRRSVGEEGGAGDSSAGSAFRGGASGASPSGLVGGGGGGGKRAGSDVGHTSDRDADDEDDETADVSSASATDETSGVGEDSEEEDRIAIKFRSKQANFPGDAEGMKRRSSSTSSASPPPDAVSSGGTPKPRKDSRFVPTSPRQTRTTSSASQPPSAQSSPHTSSLAGASPYLSVPSPQQPSLRLAIPNMPRAGPLSPGSAALSPRAQAVRNAAHARLVASGSGTGSNAPPVMRATRVFSQDTDPTTVKQQGLAALQRFVESMEQSQGAPGGGAGTGGQWQY